ncbi:hypothetical protein ILUMI_17807 [Ignelater luminosus]|uniref:Uncharacterized protein n=1 Tax=Ignelater luminosus TaxID=2038154 RepID=A0A8K0CML7_IGNLU|nr:hypothetical protein ILUMI_17807 [Ignelater luminosus]
MKDKHEMIKQEVSLERNTINVGSYLNVCTPSNEQNELKSSTLMSDLNGKHSQTVSNNKAVSQIFSKRTRKKSEKENLPPKVHSMENSIVSNITKDTKLEKKTECASVRCRRSPRLLNKNLRLNCVAVATKGLTYCADCMNNKGENFSVSSCRHMLLSKNRNNENSTLETSKDDMKLKGPLEEIVDIDNAIKNEDSDEDVQQQNKILKLSNKNLRLPLQNKPVKEEITSKPLKLEDGNLTRLGRKRKLPPEDNVKEDISSDKIKDENFGGSISIPLIRRQSSRQKLLTQANNELEHKEKVPKEEIVQGTSKSFSEKSENLEVNTSMKRSRSSLQNKPSKPKQQMFIVHTFFKQDLEKVYPELLYKSKTRPSENFSFALRPHSTTETRKSLRKRGYSNSDEDFEPSKAELNKTHSTYGTRNSLRNISNTKEDFELNKAKLSKIEHSTKGTRNTLKNRNSKQSKVEISKSKLDNETISSENSRQQSDVSTSNASNVSLDNVTSSSSTNQSSNLPVVDKEIMNIKNLLENDLKSNLGYKVFKRYQSQMLAKENKENDYQYWHQAVKEELVQISKQIPLSSLQGYMNWSINYYINSSISV